MRVRRGDAIRYNVSMFAGLLRAAVSEDRGGHGGANALKMFYLLIGQRGPMQCCM